jgi:hypothetical protein
VRANLIIICSALLYLEISQVEERVILFILCEARRPNTGCSERVDVYDAVITSLVGAACLVQTLVLFVSSVTLSTIVR